MPEDLPHATAWKRSSSNPGFFTILERCPWPGNVRELFNVIEHAFFATGERPTIHIMDLPQEIRIEMAQLSVKMGLTIGTPQPPSDGAADEDLKYFFAHGEPSIKDVKNRVECRYLEEIIRHTEGDVHRMLEISGLSRSHLYAMIKRFNLTRYLKNKHKPS